MTRTEKKLTPVLVLVPECNLAALRNDTAMLEDSTVELEDDVVALAFQRLVLATEIVVVSTDRMTVAVFAAQVLDTALESGMKRVEAGIAIAGLDGA